MLTGINKIKLDQIIDFSITIKTLLVFYQTIENIDTCLEIIKGIKLLAEGIESSLTCEKNKLTGKQKLNIRIYQKYTQ